MDSTNFTQTPILEDILQLKHYEIRSRLGEGGFGQVFEAWDTKLCRSVAIKRLKNLGSGINTASLVKEARLAASLQHAAFVKIHAIEDDDDSQSIVMELVPGLTLKEWIKLNPSDEKRALEIIAQVADAMQEAHESSLIHGDLKPSNLIIEPNGKVRILDFGLAIKGDLQATTSLSQQDPEGTIAYMAPERFSGGLPNAQSDIFALGVILYEMLNGSRPFASLNGLALAAAQMQSSSDQWPYAEHISTKTIQLIRAMTARDVKVRCHSMQMVHEKILSLEANTLSNILSNNSDIGEQGVKRGSISAWWHAHGYAKYLLASLLLIATATSVWYAIPYLPNLQKSLAPFSETVEMQAGLHALKYFDRQGNLDKAEAHFNTILTHRPNNAAAVAGLALTYSFRYSSDGYDKNWLQKASASAQRAVELNDQLALSQIAQAWVLNLQGKSEMALAIYDKVFKLNPNDVFAWQGKINTLVILHRLEDAKELTQQAMQRFPLERVFADTLGTIYFQQNNYSAAEKEFRRSIKIEPDAVYAYANLNGMLLFQGRLDEALQVLQQGLQIRPNSFLYTNLGNTLFMRGDYVAAAAAFESAVSPDKGNPNNSLLWANLADTLLWIPGRKEEAVKAYQKAIVLLEPNLQQAPNDFTLLSRMGLYLARTGDARRATELIENALKLAPKNPSVYFRAGLAHELLGNRKLALDFIIKAKSFGYPTKSIEAEPDLIELRRDASYQ